MEKNYLKCNFCNQLYDDKNRCPRMIHSCGHSICTACMTSFVESQAIVKCPEDHMTVSLVGKSVDDFKLNLVLMNILQTKEPTSQKSSTEQLKTNQVESKFEKQPHLKLVHLERSTFYYPNSARSSTGLARTPRSIDSMVQNSPDLCSTHFKNLEAICMSPECQTRVCLECALFGPHAVV